MYTPVNPSFTLWKWGFNRVKIIQACFRDVLGIFTYIDVLFFKGNVASRLTAKEYIFCIQYA